jgi:hypothetical protein
MDRERTDTSSSVVESGEYAGRGCLRYTMRWAAQRLVWAMTGMALTVRLAGRTASHRTTVSWARHVRVVACPA